MTIPLIYEFQPTLRVLLTAGGFFFFFSFEHGQYRFFLVFLFFGHIFLHFLCIFTQLGLSRVTVKRYITEGDGARKGRVR